ncbi:hypothetical protein [Methylobacterium durans]|uniref:hypothetical protein n=1 Tax=Methylobacterium durans TaxID=2202825 RepID=UPI0013A57793|nr:hypothetical protein [Methylobacterium durans]
MKYNRPLGNRTSEAGSIDGETLRERLIDRELNKLAQLSAEKVLNDSEWTRLSQLSRLKEVDRYFIDRAIIKYRSAKTNKLIRANVTPADARKELEKLARDAENLHVRIERAFFNNGTRPVLFFTLELAQRADEILSLLKELERFAEVARTAFGQCNPGRRGPADRSLHDLISSAALLWTRRTRLPLSVSNKRLGPDPERLPPEKICDSSEKKWNALDFIIAVVRVADPEAWRSNPRFPNRSMDDCVRDILKAIARRLRTRES